MTVGLYLLSFDDSNFYSRTTQLQYCSILPSMARQCTIVYRQNKKHSNISQLHRYSLLKSIFLQGTTIKQAASKYKIHYSTAKEIVRQAKKTKIVDILKNQKLIPTPNRMSAWKNIEQEVKLQPSNTWDMSQSGQSLNIKTKIQVISTIGQDLTAICQKRSPQE